MKIEGYPLNSQHAQHRPVEARRRRRILPRRNKHTTDHSRNRTTNKTRNGSKSRLSLLVIKPRRIRIW